MHIGYVITLFLSGATFLFLKSRWSHHVPSIFFWLHFFIVSWSALIYLNLVFGTPLAPYTYYADWLVSTPLIMVAVGLTALYPLKKIAGPDLFALAVTQFMVIVTGILAQVSPTQQGMLTFSGIGNAFMLLLLYLLLGPFIRTAQKNKQVAQKYTTLLSALLVLWFSYPLVWILGSPTYQIISPTTTRVLFIVLPILCKLAFGFIDLILLNALGKNSVN